MEKIIKLDSNYSKDLVNKLFEEGWITKLAVSNGMGCAYIVLENKKIKK